MRRATSLERDAQAEIMLAIGAAPDLLIMKNSIGKAKYVNDDGSQFTVPYGLAKGSPDLVGILKVGERGCWFCLECKTDVGELSEDQIKIGLLWTRFGAYVAVARNADDARRHLEQAREFFK